MTFNREDFPPIDETVFQLILDNKFILAIKAYRESGGSYTIEGWPYNGYNIGLKDAKEVIEYERDRLLKDRSLSKETSDLLAHNVRNMLDDMATTLANRLCVTRAHVLDHMLREASKLLKKV
jgi:hypothetical protein